MLPGYRRHGDYLYKANLKPKLFKIAHNSGSINLAIADIPQVSGYRDEAQRCAAPHAA